MKKILSLVMITAFIFTATSGFATTKPGDLLISPMKIYEQNPR